MCMLKRKANSKSRSTAAKLSAPLLAAALGLTLGASPAWAQSNEEYVPIGHDDDADGVDDRWTVKGHPRAPSRSTQAGQDPGRVPKTRAL